MRNKLSKAWEERTEFVFAFADDDDYNENSELINREMCLLFGYAHHIVRNQTLNANEEWAKNAKKISYRIPIIGMEQKIDQVRSKRIGSFRRKGVARPLASGGEGLNHLYQFEYRTGSTKALAFECRNAVRRFLASAVWQEREQNVRQKAAHKGTPFGKLMLKKLNEVKKAALAHDSVTSAKGICLLVQLRDYLANNEQMEEDKMGTEEEKVRKWWPNKCDQKEKAEWVLEVERVSLRQQNRECYPGFMEVWRQMVKVRGAPTRLFKLLQLSEWEIELEWGKNEKQCSDENVFRNQSLLELHYIRAFSTDDSAEHEALKLAADLFIWVLWFEKEILQLDNRHAKAAPRLTMAWKQNRWYYEMTYDKLFDIEKQNEREELAKIRQEIGILLQESKKFVEQKRQMTDANLKIELRSKRLQRLQQPNRTAPPFGTLDRELYDIRRKVMARDGKVEPEFEQWLQQMHFNRLRDYVSQCNEFNAKFVKVTSKETLKRVAEFVGEENADEINRKANDCFGKLPNFDGYSVDGTHIHAIYMNPSEILEDIRKSEEIDKEKEAKEEEEKPFDLDATMAFLNFGDTDKKGKMAKKDDKDGTKSSERRKKGDRKKQLKGELTDGPHKTPTESSNLSVNLDEKSHLSADECENGIMPKSDEICMEKAKKSASNQKVKKNKVEKPKNEKEKRASIKPKENEKGSRTPKNKKNDKMPNDDNAPKTPKTKKEKTVIRPTENECNEKLEKEKKKHQIEQKINDNAVTDQKNEIKETILQNEKKAKKLKKSNKNDGDEQKEFESIGLIDEKNELQWRLFVEDKFLVKSFQKLFVNPSPMMQKIITIGCFINEIDHRVKLINKFYHNGHRIVVLSKSMNKKLQQNWQKIIKSDQSFEKSTIKNLNSPAKSDRNLENSPIENMYTPAKRDRIFENLAIKNQNSPAKSDRSFENSPAKSDRSFEHLAIKNQNSPAKSDRSFENTPRKNYLTKVFKNPKTMATSPVHGKNIEDKFGMKILRKNLWKQFKMVQKYLDIINWTLADDEDENDDETKLDFVEKQINLRKMAIAILSEKSDKQTNFECNLNDKLNAENWETIIKTMLGHPFDNLDKFDKFSSHFLELMNQIRKNTKFGNELATLMRIDPTFIEFSANSLHLQEIKALNENGNEQPNQSDGIEKTKLLSEFLLKNGYGLIDNDRRARIDHALKQIEISVRKWYIAAKLVLTGSYQFGALTNDADIDAICVVPDSLTLGLVGFFGSAKCEFKNADKRICKDNSLFCKLCLMPNLVKISRIRDAWVPIIGLTLAIDPTRNISIDLDISFTSLSAYDAIFQLRGPINYAQSDALSFRMANQIDQEMANSQQPRASTGVDLVPYSVVTELTTRLRSLAGFEVSTIILNLLTAKEKGTQEEGHIQSTFCTLLLAIKMWAKEHHIYDNKLGFFNGISLSILVAKVMLLYPMASMPFLLEKFFYTFSTWPWPTPVKLTDWPRMWSTLRWNPKEEMRKRNEIYSTRGLAAELALPIVTPGHIEQNATFNMNKSSATIIQREMQNATETIRNWANLTISWEDKWDSLLKGQIFEEKYGHYIRITCKSASMADFDDFCGYAETRIRLQLLIDIERFDHIRLAHGKQIIANEQFIEEVENENGTNNGLKRQFYRKVWLVGIELDDNILTEDLLSAEEINYNQQTNWAEWSQRLNSMLSSQFDSDIVRAYRIKKNLMDASLNVQLSSNYEKRG
ncbi:hypothetical protein niasHT_029230 [Heterodera trifolii]|uniref:polynucleotide adenylyltransferase n=1 Tax=Heterodera trifolii TaxID=157864 RepID=A0ABD2JED7_9BILA